MKKIALLLAFIISTSAFAGCGDDDSSEKKSSKSGSDKSSSETFDDDSSKTKNKGKNKKDDEYEAEYEDEDEDIDIDTDEDENYTPDDPNPVRVLENSSGTDGDYTSGNSDLTRGIIKSGVYINDFANLRFQAPDGWEFANDEYIASMLNIGLDVAGKNDEFTKTLLEQTTIYDAVCTETSTGKNIIIMYENLAKEVPDPDTFSVEDYMDTVQRQLGNMGSITYTAGARSAVAIGGERYIRQAYTAEYSGMANKIEQVYYVRKVGKYMLGIIMSSGQTSDDMTAYEYYLG